MRYMTSQEIRDMWYKYFESKEHKRIESAPLVPINDDSLLWINAGVAPLKKYFDGTEVPESRRLCSVQKCIRTNDIDNVGRTPRHQTFFEMMGNFSIGDYFREEAIEFAWELLTSDEWFAIPKEKLYVTVYIDDDDTYNKWVSVGMIEDHIVRLEGNFWEIGEGPCGPDSEIFYDQGEKYDPNHDALEKFKNDEDQDRYVEIWNNVFSQFNSKEGMDRKDYPELPSKNIDTGAGLERWACVFQNVYSNFDTDLFTPIIKQIEDLSGVLYDGNMEHKVIADHIRAITMALSAGAIFENVGRGYVLRRLLRRSVRMGKKLGLNEPFMYKIVSTVVDIMGTSYPELKENRAQVEALVLDEEELFHKTLASGERKLIELMNEAKDKYIPGSEVFKLYDTYGFPYELTLEYLDEQGYKTSKDEFDSYMQDQKELAKKNRKQDSSMNIQNEELLNFKDTSEFVYGEYSLKGKVIGLFDGDKFVDNITKKGYIILDKTCFYAESGGQVADTGMITSKNFKARVLDVKKTPNGQHLHEVKILDGEINIGDEVKCDIDTERRKKIEVNHSSVHITQYALRTNISDKIHQAGSYVDDTGFRFDFTYTGKILDDKVIEIEDFINDYIAKNIETVTEIMSLEEAKKTGAMALFSEKYGKEVRVVTIGDSKELCGGTHVKNTDESKKLAIVNIESKGSNVYRIEGVTNDLIEDRLLEAIKPYNDEKIKLLMKAKNIISIAKKEGIDLMFDIDIKTDPPQSYKDIVFEKNELEYAQDEVKSLEKKYKEEKEKKALNDLSVYDKDIKKVDDYSYIITKVDNQDNNVLKSVADSLLNKIEKGYVVIANIKDESISYIVRSNIESKKANDLISKITTSLDGKGGGSPTFAQGGSPKSSKLDKVLEELEEII